jgi:HD-like signal output (HDOD) protein
LGALLQLGYQALQPKTKVAIRNLPPFSPVALRLLTALRNEDVSYREVMDILKTDAAFCTELLRMANSAAVGCRFPTESILQALTILGIPRVASLAVTLAFSKFLRPVAKLPVLRRCWRHNLATGLVSAELAGQFQISSETAYMYGLLHDIGRLGLLIAFPKSYSEIAEIANASGQSLCDLELAAFGFDHREIGAWIAVQWNLPPDVVDVSLSHGVDGNPVTPISILVSEACRVANRIGFSVSERLVPQEISETDPAELGTRVIEQVNRLEQEYGL